MAGGSRQQSGQAHAGTKPLHFVLQAGSTCLHAVSEAQLMPVLMPLLMSVAAMVQTVGELDRQ